MENEIEYKQITDLLYNLDIPIDLDRWGVDYSNERISDRKFIRIQNPYIYDSAKKLGVYWKISGKLD